MDSKKLERERHERAERPQVPDPPYSPVEDAAGPPNLERATEQTRVEDLAELATLTPVVLGGLVQVLNDHGDGLAELRVHYDLDLRTVEFTAEVCPCDDDDEAAGGE